MTLELLNKLLELAPLWWSISVLVVAAGMRFYYGRFSKLEDISKEIAETNKELRTLFSAQKDKVSTLNTKQQAADECLCQIEKSTEDFDKWRTQTDYWRASIDEKLTRIDDVLSDIAEWVMKKDNNMIGNISRKRSPLRLTELGLALYRESGAKQIVEEHIEELICALEAKHPQTAYDVEQSAYKVAYEKLSAPYFKPIKDFLYLAPDPYEVLNPETEQKEPVKLNIITMSHIISLPLRDEYLKRHPELDPMLVENEPQKLAKGD